MKKNHKKVNSDCAELDLDVRGLIIKRNFVKAERLAKEKLKRSNVPVNYYTLALSLATHGFLQNINSKKQEAKKYYKKIIENFPNTMHAHLAKARIYEENYKLKYAIPFYKKALEMCPTSLNAIHIGNAYKQLKKLGLARKYYLLAKNYKNRDLK